MSSTIAIPTSRSSAAAYSRLGQSRDARVLPQAEGHAPPAAEFAECASPSPSHSLAAHQIWGDRSALSKEECTHINVGETDGAIRLISYLASSQGFMWNPEMFLPSYLDLDYEPLENRREPVHEIRLSDEEIKNIHCDETSSQDYITIFAILRRLDSGYLIFLDGTMAMNLDNLSVYVYPERGLLLR
ncbi:hypothetical protein GQX73_g4285 [Xylaria multiplex]|uniref:Uncharacterized protein n=1 Tax=Xylaria multiplex TaxID=323545 RepID=A0A7C8MVU8_9PEZI|nr:hypothetical protein GQX73_g4285 [Xylaria multiplex]